MKAYDFLYDGRSLRDFGFMICKFDSRGMQTNPVGSVITFNTVPTLKGAKYELTSSEYSNCLTSSFQICKHPCITDVPEITVDETREIMRWLNRKGFHKFKLLDDDEYVDIYFEATFNVSKIEMDGKVYGFELELTTNRPYALQEPITIVFEATESNNVKKIYSKSDDEGYIYPEMKITIRKDGDFELYNELENRTMRIANCSAGEIITVNYPVIESSLSSHKIQNDFNWKFFRIANKFRDTENEITVSLPCNIIMTYSPVVKVGI